MDSHDKECILLYKQGFHHWMENQRKGLQFGKKHIDLVDLVVSQAAKDDDSFCPCIIENSIGSLYYTVNIQDLELFTFTDQINNTVTTFKLSLEDSNLECLFPDEDEAKQHADKCDLLNRYNPAYVCKVIFGSKMGSKFLAYTNDGRIILVDWITKIGKIAGKWPIDPKLNSGCYGLVEYEPRIEGAISADGSFVAAIGPSVEPKNHSYIEIRMFYTNTQECLTKKLFIMNPKVSESDIISMSINPCHPHVFYLLFGYDFGNKMFLIVYDHIEETVLSKRSDVVMSGPFSVGYYYGTTDGPVFIHQGSILIVYYESMNEEDERMYNHIFLLDAFNLNIIATVNLSPIDIILKQFFVISTCQTEIAIFTSNDNVDQVEVFKIPDCNISLKNLCRRRIMRNVDQEKVDELTMLPSTVRNYLKL